MKWEEVGGGFMGENGPVGVVVEKDAVEDGRWGWVQASTGIYVWAHFLVLVNAYFFWFHKAACFFWFPNTISSHQVLSSKMHCGTEPKQSCHTPTVKQSCGFSKRELESKRLSLRILHSPLQSSLLLFNLHFGAGKATCVLNVPVSHQLWISIRFC